MSDKRTDEKGTFLRVNRTQLLGLLVLLTLLFALTVGRYLWLVFVRGG